MLPPELGELILCSLVRRSDYHDYQRLLVCAKDSPQLTNLLKKSYEADLTEFNYQGEELPAIVKEALTSFYGVFDLNDLPEYREVTAKMILRYGRPVGKSEITIDDLHHSFNFTPEGIIDGVGIVEDSACRREFLHERGRLLEVKTVHFSPENMQWDHTITFSRNPHNPVVGVKETPAYRMELIRPHHLRIISNFTGHVRTIALELEEERPEVRQAFM